MSREEALDKLETGSYVIVPKWLTIIRNIVTPAAFITLIFLSGGWKNSIEANTFDNPKQKAEVIQHLGSGETISLTEKTQIINSISNNQNEIANLKVKTDNYVPRNEIILLLESISKDTKANKELLLRLEKSK